MMRRVLFFRAALTLLLALGIATAAGAATKTFVKDVMLIGGSKSETDDLKATYTSQGWIVINKDLNDGAGGDYIYLLYKADSDYDNNTSYVSDFFLWRADDTSPNTRTYNNRTYNLVPYYGGSAFVESKGHLNRGTSKKGADIHLYYTKAVFPDYRIVTSIFFNDTQSGALGPEGGTSGYDLNKYANGDTIYMHFTTDIAPGHFPMPDNVVVSSCLAETATLTWTVSSSGLTVTGYTYKFREANGGSWSAEVTTTNASATIAGLKPDTDYDFYVRTLYGDDASDWTVCRLTTAARLPYEFGFEDGLGHWEMKDPFWGYTGITNFEHHEGSYSFRFYGYPSEYDPQYLISPRFAGFESLAVSFYHYCKTYCVSTFSIGYSTTDKEISSFTWVDDITPTTSWVNYERTFPSSTRYFALRFDKYDDKYLPEVHIDDFRIVAYSPYAKPEELAISDLTETRATLSWTAPSGTITGYKYQYGKVEVDAWSPEISETGTSVTLSMLTPNTLYEFRLWACHSGNHVSNCVTTRFMTEAPMVDFPYTESFENGMGGWRILDGSNKSGITQDNSHHGGKCFKIDARANSSQYLISPQFDGSTGIRLSFWASNFVREISSTSLSYSEANYSVGYSTTTKDLSAFTWEERIRTWNLWTKYTYDYPSGIKYLAIRMEDGLYLFLDDFRFYTPEVSPTAVKATFMGEEKYITTFYNSAAAYQLPSGSVAYTASLDGDDLVFIRIGDGDSNVIPADTPVIIVSDKTPDDGDAQTKDIVLTALDSTDVSAREGNVLHASDTGTAVTDGKIDGKTVYVLGIVNDTLGFYPYSLGAIPARKAYILK